MSDDAELMACRLADIPVMTSLIPQNKSAIPIKNPARFTPNEGAAIIAMAKPTAIAPAATLNALDALPAVT